MNPAEEFFKDYPSLMNLSNKEIARRCGATEKQVISAKKHARENDWLTLESKARSNINEARRLGDPQVHYCPECKHVTGWKHWEFLHECTRVEQLYGGFRTWWGIPDEYLREVAECVPGTLWAEVSQ